MRLQKWLYAFIGIRRVRCEGIGGGMLLTYLMRAGINYWSLAREPDGALSFSVTESGMKKLIKSEPDLPLVTLERTGLPVLLRRYRRRIGIPIGLALSLFLTWLSTQYVWEITVSGNETLSDAAVIGTLEKLGCTIGTYIPSVDFYGICHRFLLENDDVSWISVNMVGTTAEIRLIETDKKGTPEDGNGSPCHLIAARAGEIVRTETAAGQTAVLPGEQVSEGQLLVSGIVSVGQGSGDRLVLVRSRGRIWARTERRFEVEIPLTRTDRVEIGRKIDAKTLNFFGKPIKLEENSSNSTGKYDIIEESRRIVLLEGDRLIGEIPLPVFQITTYRREYEETVVSLSEEEALTEASLRMTALVGSALADAEILKRTEETELRNGPDGESIALIWTILCIEDIVEEAPIGRG